MQNQSSMISKKGIILASKNISAEATIIVKYAGSWQKYM